MICKPKMVISRVKILVHLFSLFQTVCDCSTSFKDKQQRSKRSFKKIIMGQFQFSHTRCLEQFSVSPKFQVVVYPDRKVLLIEVNCNNRHLLLQIAVDSIMIELNLYFCRNVGAQIHFYRMGPLTKGQLISKCLLGVFNFFQKNEQKHVAQQQK